MPGPLHAEREAGDFASDVPLVLLHGFTQTKVSWDPLLDALERLATMTRPVIRVDLPGHGQSGGIAADLATTADLVIETCGRAIYCGYSMGGRVALHGALQHPEEVAALVAIGATAGIEDEDERRERRIADEALADSIEQMGVDAFIEKWLAQPMFAGLVRSESDLAARRANSASGLAESLRRSGTGTQSPLWSRLGELRMPVLLLAGSLDVKFSALAERMVASIGSNASFISVPDSGHAAHLESPETVASKMAAFLHGLP